MKRYNTTAPLPAEVETSTPARPADLVADLLVPFFQAAVTGGLLAGLVVFGVAQTNYNGDLFKLWSGLALGISTVAWLISTAVTLELSK